MTLETTSSFIVEIALLSSLVEGRSGLSPGVCWPPSMIQQQVRSRVLHCYPSHDRWEGGRFSAQALVSLPSVDLVQHGLSIHCSQASHKARQPHQSRQLCCLGQCHHRQSHTCLGPSFSGRLLVYRWVISRCMQGDVGYLVNDMQG